MGSILGQGTKIPHTEGATKPMHCNKDPEQPKPKKVPKNYKIYETFGEECLYLLLLMTYRATQRILFRSIQFSRSVMSNSLQLHELQHARPPYPWNFSRKNTWVGCHFLLQELFLTQGSTSCLLCLLHWKVDLLPLGPPGSWLCFKFYLLYAEICIS